MKEHNNTRVTLGVSRETKEILNSIKHAGQSYDGVLRELAGFWNEQKRKKVKRSNNGLNINIPD